MLRVLEKKLPNRDSKFIFDKNTFLSCFKKCQSGSQTNKKEASVRKKQTAQVKNCKNKQFGPKAILHKTKNTLNFG